MNKTKFFAIILLVITSIFFGCNTQKTMPTVESDNLFSLSYGNFEDELQLFSLNSYGTENTKLVMKDGFFFISDDYAKKIMQFTSYGDLIGIIYNSETNPTPSFVKEIGDEQSNKAQIRSTTQVATTYKFNHIEDLVIDSKKNIYVVEELPSENQEYDSEHNIFLREIILRFSNDGTFIDYIGQEGQNGTPFAHIESVYMTKNNELVVICLTGKEHLVFWFNEGGFLKWTIPIRSDSIPSEVEDAFITIDKVVPDYTQSKLYIKTDYHQIFVDEESNIQTGIEYLKTLLHVFNVENAEFEDAIEIPPYEDVVVDRFSKLTYKNAFYFLGVTESKHFFFINPDESGFVVQIVQSAGQKIIKRHINYDSAKAVFVNFSLSDNGIISALIAENEKSNVVWWRTDKLIN